MKKTLLTSAALATLALPSICLAWGPRPGPYVSGFVGVTIPNNTDSTSATVNDRVEFDPSIAVGGTGGYDFGYARVEGEISYKHGKISRVNDRLTGVTYDDINDRGAIGVVAFMGNAFVDLHNQSPITPYFGGGIGFASLHQDDTFGTSTSSGNRVQLYAADDDSVFAYQVGAGFDVALTRMLSLDVGYRYFHTGLAHFNEGTTIENDMRFVSHNVTVGVRFKFR